MVVGGCGLLKVLLGFFFLLLISRVSSHLEDICFKVNSNIFLVEPSLSLSKQSETLSFHLIHSYIPLAQITVPVANCSVLRPAPDSEHLRKVMMFVFCFHYVEWPSPM